MNEFGMKESEKKERQFKSHSMQVPLSSLSDPLDEFEGMPAIDPVREGISKQGEAIRSMKSIGDFMAFKGKLSVKLATGTAPTLGKPFEMDSQVPVSNHPVVPPSCAVRGAKKVEILGGPTSESLSARQKLTEIQNRLNLQSGSKKEETPAQTASQKPTSPEELKLGISVERLVFLERVEKIMASEARIKEIEAENKTLVGMVTRLQKEIDDMKARAAQKL